MGNIKTSQPIHNLRSQSCQTTRKFTIKRYTPTERKIPGCEQERNQSPGKNMGKYRMQRRNHKTTKTHYAKRRHYATTGCKLVKTTTPYHQQNFIGRPNQPIKHQSHKIPQTI